MSPGTIDCAQVESALRAASRSARRVRTDEWQMSLATGATVHAARDDHWLMLTPPDRTFTCRKPWHALTANASLAGPAKLVASHHAPRATVRADVPLTDGVDVEASVRDALADFEALARHTQSARAPTRHRARARQEPPVRDEGLGDGPSVLELLCDTSWQCIERPSGDLVVQLDVPGQFRQAVVRRIGSTGCCVRVDLVTLGSHCQHVRDAVAILLLTASAAVCMARAGEVERDSTHVCFVETCFKANVSAAELEHSLAALTVACRLVGREAAVVAADEVIAREYVVARGWAA